MYLIMEGAPLVPESPASEEPKAEKAETKDVKDSKDKTLSFFEKLIKGDVKAEKPDAEAPKRLFELFDTDKKEDEKTEQPKEELVETAEAGEGVEAPLEELAEDEKQQVAEQYVEARAVEVDQELTRTPENTLEATAIQANASLLEHIQDKLHGDAPVTAEMLDQAVADTLHDLQIEDVPAEAPAELAADDIELVAPEVIESLSAGGYHEEPLAILPPVEMVPSEPTPEQASAKPAEPEIVTVPRRRREAANLLIGGTLGYMLGRRRGRLRTEAALVPVQEKLTKQVKDLHEQIAVREEKIRKLSYEQALQNMPQVQLEQPIVRAEKPMERIGNLVATERLAQFKAAERRKSPDVMTLSDLLVAAKGIKIEQSTAAKMYEAGRLNQEDLRQLVRAQARGEKLEPILRERLKPVVMVGNYETQPANTAAVTNFPTTSSIAGLVENAMQSSTQEYQPHQLPADYQPQQPALTKPKSTNSTMTMAMVIGITLGLIITLFIVL